VRIESQEIAEGLHGDDRAGDGILFGNRLTKFKELFGLAVDWMRSVLQKDPQPAYALYLPLIVATWDAGYDMVLRNSPAVVVASAPKQDPDGLVNVTLPLSYLELAATSKGLGTCWAGLVQGAMLSSPQMKKEMGIPEGHPHHYPMMLGYPKSRYFRLPERKAPKINWR
jgi:nitroreductase